MNIVRLIETQPLEKFSKKSNAIIVSKLQETFTNKEQQLFLASFWCYQNYKPEEFVINLDDVWKWLGFSRRDNAIRRVKNKLNENEDYKILHLKTDEQNDENNVLHLKTEEQNDENNVLHLNTENDQRGGHNKEQILLSIDGFKKFALKSNTKKADQIHDYYIKLERIVNYLFKEETEKLQNQLNEQTELNKKLTILFEYAIQKLNFQEN